MPKFLKVRDRIINLEAIAYVHLQSPDSIWVYVGTEQPFRLSGEEAAPLLEFLSSPNITLYLEDESHQRYVEFLQRGGKLPFILWESTERQHQVLTDLENPTPHQIAQAQYLAQDLAL